MLNRKYLTDLVKVKTKHYNKKKRKIKNFGNFTPFVKMGEEILY
jgi:hypothetical protein